MDMLNIKNVQFAYDKSRQVLNNINFSIKENNVAGFLGLNGAGKSTLIQLIIGLLKLSEGTIEIASLNTKSHHKEIKKMIGYVPQDLAIIENLTAYQNVKFFGSIYGLKGKELREHVDRALEFVQLSDRAKDKPSKFSGGLKRRLNIACGIVHNPKLIIMDEPTVGVDPQSRNYILESIQELKQQGKTVIYVSHYMEEIEAICNQVVIINNGEVLYSGDMEELKRQNGNELLNVIFHEPLEDEEKRQLLSEFKERAIFRSDTEVEIKVPTEAEDSFNQLISLKTNFNHRIKRIQLSDVTLESAFLELTGNNLASDIVQTG
ncbi:ABC-2 type transport system ATP-binding protein [Fontibacillus panacisegetis]|uniref:ABC-2 type transport system ATP-binding protein n=1 Tax=Fontibacillus panacisegetis TaxID=670482 RepID=A0A1G7I7I0_9BACL|nr:ABC transporter ATP-binding protein [Fontibacillus panacisegetis]SDF08622.1 ABC-2 type transport system ATP-binding protein [Fontibacillus panacisegetis]